jgi:hypothetical protein
VQDMVREVEVKIKIEKMQQGDLRVIKKAGRRKAKYLHPTVQQRITAMFRTKFLRGEEQEVGGEGCEVRGGGGAGQHRVCAEVYDGGVVDKAKRWRPSGVKDSPAKKIRQ